MHLLTGLCMIPVHEIMTVSHSCVLPPTVAAIVMNMTAIGAVLAMLGHFLHVKVSEL